MSVDHTEHPSGTPNCSYGPCESKIAAKTPEYTPRPRERAARSGMKSEEKVKNVKKVKKAKKVKKWMGPRYSHMFVLPKNFHFVCFEEDRLVKEIEYKMRKSVRPHEYAKIKKDGRHNILERIQELMRIKKSAKNDLEGIMSHVKYHINILRAQQKSEIELTVVEFHKLSSLYRVQRAAKLIGKLAHAKFEREKLAIDLNMAKGVNDIATKKKVEKIRRQICALRKNISRWDILKSNLLD